MSKIVLIAGEPSGDFLGGQLAKALRAQQLGIELSGVGGPYMTAQGVQSLFNYEDLAVMGITEVASNIVTILKRIKETVDYIKNAKPDIVVTIDSPDFCFRVVQSVKAQMEAPPKFIHYVAPSVWAWRPGRAAKIAKFLDGLICLFDFEPPYFEAHSLRSVAVGHPLVEGGALEATGKAFREEFGIGSSEQVIGVLFGSRKGEIKRIGKRLRDAAFKLAQQMGGLPHIVAPTLPHLQDKVFDLLKDYPGPIHIFIDAEHKWDAFASCNIALAVSGTVGLELAAMRVPHVIAYRANPLTFEMIKRLVKVRFAHLANIMEDAEVVPEFIQGNCKPDRIADSAYQIWAAPERQVAEFDHVRFRIGAGHEQTPSERAASFVLSYLP